MRHRRFNLFLRVGAVCLDTSLITLTFILAAALRNSVPFLSDPTTLNSGLERARPVGIILWILLIAIFRGYSTREYGVGTEAYRRVLNASLAGFSLLATIVFLLKVPLSRAFFVLLFVIGIPLLLLGRWAGRRVVHYLYRQGHGIKSVLIVGSADQIEELTDMLTKSQWLGLLPVGAVTPDTRAAADLSIPRLDASRGLLTLADEAHIDLILFASGSVPSSTDFRRFVWQFEGHQTQLAVVPSLVDTASDRIRSRPISGLPIIFIEDPRSDRALSRGKRLFDVVVASLMLLTLSPVLLITACAVKLTDRGPVFFTQERVGRDGHPFTMLKFRSMVVDAEKRLAELQGGNDTNAVMFKLEKDPRITTVGSFIRRFSIDELPQLINVLRGDMSLIGPRPPLPREVALYSDDEWRRLRVRPGLTGLWQVSGRSDLSWDETIRLDLYYIDNWSALQDVAILLKTVRAVFSSRGAY